MVLKKTVSDFLPWGLAKLTYLNAKYVLAPNGKCPLQEPIAKRPCNQAECVCRDSLRVCRNPLH